MIRAARVGAEPMPAGLGPKGAWLDRASRAGLPVPDAWVVPDEARAHAIGTGLLKADGHRMVVDADPAALVASLGLEAVTGARVAVRSAFAVEDGAGHSMAGAFLSVLDVDADDLAALADALAAVWSSWSPHHGGRADVLIQRMVAPVRAGVAFTEPDHEDDLAESVPGLADELLRGGARGERWELPKLRAFEGRRGPVADQPIRARVQLLLRDLRRLHGAAAGLDVEWADDGARCWLLQVRPVTAATRRDEVFTVANHKEILPELPSRLMADVLRSCAGDLFAWYRAFDPELPRDRPFLEVFEGRPRINLSLLTDTMRIWGLPTRLVTDSIGGRTDAAVGLQPRRVLRKLPALARLGWAQLRAVRASTRLRHEILARAGGLGDGFGDCVAALRDVYVRLVHGMFGLTAAMSGPLAALRRAGTLDAHGRTHRTVTTRMWNDLDALRPLIAARPGAAAACAAGRLPDDADAARAIADWLVRHGHRGPFESDVGRPRFAEDPTPVLRALAATTPARPPRRAGRSLATWLTVPLWLLARRPMAAREELRSDAMRAFASIRTRLWTLADAATQDGRLPEPDAVWDLEIAELLALDSGARFDAGALRARRDEIAAQRAVRLSDQFRRSDPTGDADRQVARPDEVRRTLRGLGLTHGVVEGTAVVIGDPTGRLPEGVDPGALILVAPAIDAGWIPLLSAVAGAVVETGGELSHGSIVLREIGLPAATNVDRAFGLIRSGERIRLCGSTGRVDRLGETSRSDDPEDQPFESIAHAPSSQRRPNSRPSGIR